MTVKSATALASPLSSRTAPPGQNAARSRGRLIHLCLLALLLVTACTPRVGPRDPFSLPGEEKKSDGVSHTVKAYEDWGSIAEDYYGDPRAQRRLRRANRAFAGGDLAAGMEVFIPLSDSERRAFEQRAAARAPYNRGLGFARGGDYPEAITQFREAIRIDPRLAAAHYNLGLVYRRSGRNALALEPLERASGLRTKNGDYLYAWGATAQQLGDHARAERCFHQAIERDGEHLPSIYALARLLDGQGRGNKATKLWRLYLRLDPGSARGAEASMRLEGAP